MTKILKENQLLKIVETGIDKLKRVKEFNDFCHFLPIEKMGKDVLFKFRNKKTKELFSLKVYFDNVSGEGKRQSTASTDGKTISFNFYYIANQAEEPFEKCVNCFIHEMIHIYQLNILKISIINLLMDSGGHGKSFLSMMESIHNSMIQTVKKNTQKTTRKFINPGTARKDSFSKAKKLFEGFNHYPVDQVKKINIPIDRNTVFSKLGFVDNLEYISDKKVFKSDQKTRKRKIRTYIHNFSEHGKYPYLFSNEDGSVLIIYDPNKKIEVKPEGII